MRGKKKKSTFCAIGFFGCIVGLINNMREKTIIPSEYFLPENPAIKGPK